jgi:hypothetical protein
MWSWRQMSPSGVVTALVIAAISIAASMQNNKFQGQGQDILDLGSMPDGYTALTELNPHLGVRYEHIGIHGIDFWRYGGQLIVYSDLGTSADYRDLDDDEADQLGASVPWRYYFPEGLIALACLAEILIVGRKRRTIRFALITGGVLAVVAIAFRIKGLTWECVFPGVLAIHHLGTALLALRAHDDSLDASPPEKQPPATPRDPLPPPPPRGVETDPFRAPPQPPPIAVQPPAPPAPVPIQLDENAEAPKLLR